MGVKLRRGLHIVSGKELIAVRRFLGTFDLALCARVGGAGGHHFLALEADPTPLWLAFERGSWAVLGDGGKPRVHREPLKGSRRAPMDGLSALGESNAEQF